MVEELKRVYGVGEEPALSAFEDYAGLCLMVEQINGDFERRGVPVGNARGRHLLNVRIRVSQQLERSREAMIEAVKATQLMIAFRERGNRGDGKAAKKKERQPSAEAQAPDPAVAALMLQRANLNAAVARELYIRDSEREAADRYGVLGDHGEADPQGGVAEAPARVKKTDEVVGPSLGAVPVGCRLDEVGEEQAEQDRVVLVSELRQLLREFPEGAEKAERYREWLDADAQLTDSDVELLRAELEGIRRARSAGSRRTG